MALRGLLMTVVGFFSGSLMFSAWLARLAGGDVRRVGDGNPGPVSAFRSAGPIVGSIALLLDFLKGWLVNHIQGTDRLYVPHLKEHGY